MQILVFGKTGQVATELAIQGGAGVTCLSRSEVDLSDPEACAQIVATTKADVIINAAAYTAVDKAEDEEALATIINGQSVTRMAQEAAKRDIPFLHISTDYVFDGTGTRPRTPADATGPIGAYGRSKLVGEQGVTAAAGPHAILRTSWVYSAHGNNFVKTMLRLGTDRDALSVVDDQIGGPTSAADIARALLVMAKAFYQGNGESGVYHFAGQPSVSWADFARDIFAQSGLKVDVTGIPTSQYPTPAQRPLNSRMDCSDVETVFGVSCFDYKESLGEVLGELLARAKESLK